MFSSLLLLFFFGNATSAVHLGYISMQAISYKSVTDKDNKKETSKSARYGKRGGVLFHPMRLLLTGSSCLEKSPLSAPPSHGRCATSIWRHWAGSGQTGKAHWHRGSIRAELVEEVLHSWRYSDEGLQERGEKSATVGRCLAIHKRWDTVSLSCAPVV